MLPPTLHDLPAPASPRTGWPWTEGSPPLPDTMPDGSPWPRISIVTPSYNQGWFIETAIRSVLLQGYLNVEYLIIDGGSTDNTLDILERYSPWVHYWVMEPDFGQSDAINKGLSRATGTIRNWLNCDDLYYPGAFEIIARAFHERPGAGLIYFDMDVLDVEANFVKAYPDTRPWDFETFLHDDMFIPMPSAFFTQQAWDSAGPLNNSLHYGMDWDLYLRIARQFEICYVPQTVSGLREYPQTKSASGGLQRLYEIRDMLESHGSRAPRLYYKMGLWHYQRNQMVEARRYFIIGLRRQPPPELRNRLLRLTLKSLLGGRIMDRARAARQRLGF